MDSHTAELEQFLEATGLQPQRVGDPPTFVTRFRGRHAEWTCVAQVVEAQARIVFFSVFPSAVPAARRPSVAEFLTLANYGLLSGNFEMSLENGDLRFRTSLDVVDGPAGAARLERLVGTNLATMDTYLPALRQVVAGEGSPPDILAALLAQ